MDFLSFIFFEGDLEALHNLGSTTRTSIFNIFNNNPDSHTYLYIHNKNSKGEGNTGRPTPWRSISSHYRKVGRAHL